MEQLQSVMAFTDAPPKDTFDKSQAEELRSWVSRGAEAAAGPHYHPAPNRAITLHPHRHATIPSLTLLQLMPVRTPSSSLLGPIDPSFRALSGRLKFTV